MATAAPGWRGHLWKRSIATFDDTPGVPPAKGVSGTPQWAGQYEIGGSRFHFQLHRLADSMNPATRLALALTLVIPGGSFGLRANPADVSAPADDGLGQLTAPVETISLRQEAAREVCILGQHARGGRLVLTPDSCFFHGRLHLTGEVTPQYPGAELNGNKSWSRIEGLSEPDTRVVWALWLPQAATLKLSITPEVPAAAAGTTLEVGLGETKQTVTLQAADGSGPQPEPVELAVTKPGLYELALSLGGPGTAGAGIAVRQVVVTGAGVENSVLVRSRWRAAAIHAKFGSSELAAAQAESRLWVMEARPLPGEASMYAPITTPFGYFGSPFEPGGKSSGINFSMWSFGKGDAEPPVERLSHLLALGDPRQESGGFDHEGTGVKPRGWNPFEGQTIASVRLALKLEPGEPYDTYTGYFLDPATHHWKLYAAGRKWHEAGRSSHNLLPGAFVEVPGPPDVQRSAEIMRGVDFRGWCRDEHGAWHALDEMTVGDIKAGEPLQKTAQLAPDGWFRLAMGGLEQYRYANSKPVIRSKPGQSTPDYLAPDRVAELDAMPATVAVKAVQKNGGGVSVTFDINGPKQPAKVTVFYGPKEALTFAERWAHHLEPAALASGEHTVEIPGAGATGACRVLVQGNFGSVWSESPATWK